MSRVEYWKLSFVSFCMHTTEDSRYHPGSLVVALVVALVVVHPANNNNYDS